MAELDIETIINQNLFGEKLLLKISQMFANIVFFKQNHCNILEYW